MPLNFSYPTEADIPAHAKADYAETDIGGGQKAWVLQGEGFASKKALDEFRTTNRGLMSERDELKTKFAGIDPEQWKTLAPLAELHKEGKLIKAEEMEQKIRERVATGVKEHETKAAALASDLEKANNRIAGFLIDGELMKAAQEIGIAQGAGPDIIARGRAVFKLGKDGQLEAWGPDGKEMWGTGGATFKTPAEWIKELAGTAKHLFAPNSGGGAGGGTGGGGGGPTGTASGQNPFADKTFNLTEAMAIVRANPARAAQLCTAAGKKPSEFGIHGV